MLLLIAEHSILFEYVAGLLKATVLCPHPASIDYIMASSKLSDMQNIPIQIVPM